MVAEPVAEAKTPIAEVVSETPVEQASPPVENVDEVPDEAVTNYLKEQKLIEGTDTSDTGDESADDDGPSLEGLTPRQILDLGKQQGKSETQTEAQAASAAYQQRARVEGARTAYANAKARATQALANIGVDPSAIGQEFDQVYGNFNQVYQADVQAAHSNGYQTAADEVKIHAINVLGPKGKELAKEWDALPADQKSSAKFFNMYTEKARAGYLSPSDTDKLVREKMSAFIKKLPKEARDAIGFNPSSTPTSGSSGSGKSIDEKLLDPATPVSELKKLMAQKAKR